MDFKRWCLKGNRVSQREIVNLEVFVDSNCSTSDLMLKGKLYEHYARLSAVKTCLPSTSLLLKQKIKSNKIKCLMSKSTTSSMPSSSGRDFTHII